jgi:hypothetical protein
MEKKCTKKETVKTTKTIVAVKLSRMKLQVTSKFKTEIHLK